MRILVTGSRYWTDYMAVYNAIRLHTSEVADVKDVVVVHGGARGADEIAGDVATNFGMQVEVHEANWESCGPDCNKSHMRQRYDGVLYCPRSGFVRNAEMVNLGADICLAFSKDNSRGTEMAAGLANKAGIPVHWYRNLNDD